MYMINKHVLNENRGAWLPSRMHEHTHGHPIQWLNRNNICDRVREVAAGCLCVECVVRGRAGWRRWLLWCKTHRTMGGCEQQRLARFQLFDVSKPLLNTHTHTRETNTLAMRNWLAGWRATDDYMTDWATAGVLHTRPLPTTNQCWMIAQTNDVPINSFFDIYDQTYFGHMLFFLCFLERISHVHIPKRYGKSYMCVISTTKKWMIIKKNHKCTRSV